MTELLGGLFIPGLILLVVAAFFVALWAASKRYKKIPPGRIGIFYGKKYPYTDPQKPNEKLERGFKVMASGGKILLPFVESYMELSTNVFQIPIEENKILNKDNVPINVRGIATCRIGSSNEEHMSAAESFLGLSEDEIHLIIKNILLGHLRTIIGNMDIDELLRNRETFNKRVIAESSAEFQRLGIKLDLVIQDVTDAEGYIQALGKRKVAEAKKDAEIKIAEANRDQEISISNSVKEAAVVKAMNDAEVAKVEKDRDIKKAQYKVEADKEKAISEKAYEIALVEQDTTVKVANANMQKEEKTALIEVEKQEVLRKEIELKATVIKPAEADKEKMKIDAEAKKIQQTIDADAEKEVKTTKSLGEAAQIKNIAEANKDKETLEGDGNASKIRAKLLAEAEGKEKELMAIAKGESERKRLDLIGQAEGTERLAKALKEMDERGQLIIILDRLPSILESGGDAGSKIMEAIFKPVASSLGNIDSLNILDMGGNGNGVNKVASIVPETVMKVFTSLKAIGLDPSDILKKLGVDPSAFSSLIDKVSIKKTETAEEVHHEEVK